MANFLSRSVVKARALINDKCGAELKFQLKWAEKFGRNRRKVLEYWQKYRHLGEIKDICGLSDDKKVLDVGCGISTVLHFIPGKRFGIDPLAGKYRLIYDYPEGIDVRSGSGEAVPFPDGWFDAVFCSNVLDHTESPSLTLNEIRRVLRPDGFFVLTVEVFDKETGRDHAHPHSLTKENVGDLISGFQVLQTWESPWFGLRNYVDGSTKSHNKELIFILKSRGQRQAS